MKKNFAREVFSTTATKLARVHHGTVVEQCVRQKPTVSGLRLKTLFHRFEIFFRAPRAPPKKVEECG
jgi:hypothetical protein